jgi:cytochrome c-type biogenesis protein CcmE
MDRKVRIQITGMFPNLMSEEKIAVKNGVLQNHGVLRSPAKIRIPEN